MSKNKIQLIFEVLKISLKLRLTSFGGPIAHLGYYHNEFILKKNGLPKKRMQTLLLFASFFPVPQVPRL
jgi:chromate transporter